MKWEISNLLMAVFLGFATFVQKNDPDAKLWMFLYGVPACICFTATFVGHVIGEYHLGLLVQSHLCLCTAIGCYSFINLINPGVTEKDFLWYEREEAREFGGMIFVVIWLEMILLYEKSGADRRERISWVACLISIAPILLWMAAYANKEYQAKLPGHCKTAL